MSAGTIGRRYERLLFFAGPLSLACLVVFLVALATERQAELSNAQCYLAAAGVLDAKKAALDVVWQEQRVRIDSGMGADRAYWRALTSAWIGVGGGPGCFSLLLNMQESDYFRAPDTLASHFRKIANVATTTSVPLRMYGVEMPATATINILGTPLKMQLITLAQALQIGLAPVLLLWLGSLYNTRQRETLYVRRMMDVRELFPHIVNVYPVGPIARPRKKNWIAYYATNALVKIAFPTIRISLVTLFVGPPVVFYVLSLYHIPSEKGLVHLALGGVVVIFGLTNLLGEILEWHLGKHFRESYPQNVAM